MKLYVIVISHNPKKSKCSSLVLKHLASVLVSVHARVSHLFCMLQSPSEFIWPFSYLSKLVTGHRVEHCKHDRSNRLLNEQSGYLHVKLMDDARFGLNWSLSEQ